MTTIAGIEMLGPGPRRAKDSDASALAGAWFEAQTRGVSLRMYASGPARHAVDAAVALNRCDALLDALDEWIGAALEWRWIATPVSVTASASHARAHWRPDESEKGANELVCRLELPWTLLRDLPAPGETLALHLHWAKVPAVLAIAQLRIDHQELSLLEPGGAVVLPESMQPGWHGMLRALDEPCRPGVGVPVDLSSPWSPRRIKIGTHAAVRAAAAGNGILCEVRLAVPHPVAGDRLAGWFEGDLGEVWPGAGLWRCATEREASRRLAAGQLMPWGDGWALALQDLSEPPVVPR